MAADAARVGGSVNSQVTVLLGVHNGADTLPRCLDSIASQSYRDWTILCVNDASTDETEQVLLTWQHKLGERLIVSHNDHNLGLTKSLNKGLSMITTRFTARIDADDWWAQDKLEQQVGFLHKHSDYGVIGCNYRNVGQHGTKQVLLPETNEQIKRSIIHRNPFAHSCVMFRTELVQSLGGYDERVRYGQDYDLWLRCLPATRFHNLPDSLCWRAVGRGISVEKQRQQMSQSIRTQLKYIRKYRLSPVNFLSLAEPLAVVLTPNWLRQLKRRVMR